MKYAVLDHHNFWQRGEGNSSIQEADVVFMWNDFCFEAQVKAMQAIGKKVIVYEHGFGAFNDYSELNNKPQLANGYLALGDKSSQYVDNCFVAGNPVYDDIYKKKEKTGKALYVALHWVRDVSGYNNKNYFELKETYDEYEWNIKTSDKATSGIDSDEVWYSGVEGVRSLPRIKSKLREYDAIFTPKAGTFDSFARLMGIPVYVIDEHESYRREGDPISYKIEGDNYIEIGEELEPRLIDMAEYIARPSVSLDKILEWVDGSI
jgi:hypothetical protein